MEEDDEDFQWRLNASSPGRLESSTFYYSLDTTSEMAEDSDETTLASDSDDWQEMGRCRKKLKRDSLDEVTLLTKIFGLDVTLTTGYHEHLLNSKEYLTNIILTDIISKARSKAYQEAIKFLQLDQDNPQGWEEKHQLILNALPQDVSSLCLTYLILTFERINVEILDDEEMKTFSNDILFQMRKRVVNEIILLLTNSNGNENSNDDSKISGAHLLPIVYHFHRNGLVSSITRELFNRDGIGGDFRLIFEPLLKELREDMIRKCSLVGTEFLQPIIALAELCMIKVEQFKPICQLLVKKEDWLPPTIFSDSFLKENGYLFQKHSYLGPFFGVSCFAFDDENQVVEDYFGFEPPPNDYEKYDRYKSKQTMVRSKLNDVWLRLQLVVRSLLEDQLTRPAMFKYIAQAIEIGGVKSEIDLPESYELCDGFILNLMSVLQTLSEDIQIGKVDLSYPFRPDALVQVSPQDQKMKMTKEEEVEGFRQKVAETDPLLITNFDTHLFFLALECHHIGISCLIKKSAKRTIRIEYHQTGRAEAENNDPAEEVELERINLLKAQWCSDASIKGKKILTKTLKFYTEQMKLIVQSVGGSDILPSSPTVPAIFSALPVWYIEDILDFMLFLLEKKPYVLGTEPTEELTSALILFFCSPHYFSHHRVLFKISNVIAMSIYTKGGFFPKFALHTSSHKHLTPALFRYYSDVETYNERFSIRSVLSAIIQGIWRYPAHQTAIKNLQESVDFFRFCKTLIADSGSSVEMLLEIVNRIHDYLKLSNDETQWQWLDADRQLEQVTEYQRSIKIIEQHQTLAIETLFFLQFVVMKDVEPFKKPFLLELLVPMLNKTLCSIDQTFFIPDEYLDDNLKKESLAQMIRYLVNIYINFNCREFYKAVKTDEENFKEDIFHQAFSRVSIGENEDEEKLIEEWKTTIKTIQDQPKDVHSSQDDSDVPDEFLDQITFALMKDPVRIQSQVLVDRNTIFKHLLNYRTNPWTNMPLIEDQIVAEPELKRRIDEWKMEKMKMEMEKKMAQKMED